MDCYLSLSYLALSVTWVVHRIWIETLKLVWGEEDASLLPFNLCKEVLLLVVMSRCHIPCGERICSVKYNGRKSIYSYGGDLKHLDQVCWRSSCSEWLLSNPLPSMPMSSRLDVSCPQLLLACCLLIQFQLKPRKSTTIFFPTVSFKVCCR